MREDKVLCIVIKPIREIPELMHRGITIAIQEVNLRPENG